MPAPLTDYNFLRKSSGPSSLEPEKPKPLTSSDFAFMQRMEGDIDGRRRTAFIVELKKDPRFKPSMLEPPKPKFKAVSLDNGPIVRTHSRRSECCRHSTPHCAASPPHHRATPPLHHYATTSRHLLTPLRPPQTTAWRRSGRISGARSAGSIRRRVS